MAPKPNNIPLITHLLEKIRYDESSVAILLTIMQMIQPMLLSVCDWK